VPLFCLCIDGAVVERNAEQGSWTTEYLRIVDGTISYSNELYVRLSQGMGTGLDMPVGFIQFIHSTKQKRLRRSFKKLPFRKCVMRPGSSKSIQHNSTFKHTLHALDHTDFHLRCLHFFPTCT